MNIIVPRCTDLPMVSMFALTGFSGTLKISTCACQPQHPLLCSTMSESIRLVHALLSNPSHATSALIPYYGLLPSQVKVHHTLAVQPKICACGQLQVQHQTQDSAAGN